MGPACHTALQNGQINGKGLRRTDFAASYTCVAHSAHATPSARCVSIVHTDTTRGLVTVVGVALLARMKRWAGGGRHRGVPGRHCRWR